MNRPNGSGKEDMHGQPSSFRVIVAGLLVAGTCLTGPAVSGQQQDRPKAQQQRPVRQERTVTHERPALPERPEAPATPEDLAMLDRFSAAVSRVAQLARPSVVSVQTVIGQFGGRQKEASGSGVVFDSVGHIITSCHVLEGATQVHVILADGRKLAAQIVGTDPKTDVAVLGVNATKTTPAKFADSSRVEVGNLVLAIGSPFRLSQTVSHGIVSATGRNNLDIEGMEYQNFIQTDAPTNPGNSGGALVNTHGEVIGINTAIAGSGHFAGVAFATPSNTVAWAARRIISGQPLIRGYLGISINPLYPEVADRLGLSSTQGVFIEKVTPNSPAGRAGLHAEDVVLEINGARVADSGQLHTLIAELSPGGHATMTIWRDGQQRKVDVTVGQQPQDF